MEWSGVDVDWAWSAGQEALCRRDLPNKSCLHEPHLADALKTDKNDGARKAVAMYKGIGKYVHIDIICHVAE